MTYRPTQIERAFVLASSGKFATVEQIRKALKGEGYRHDGQLTGTTLTRQLMKLIAVARENEGK